MANCRVYDIPFPQHTGNEIGNSAAGVIGNPEGTVEAVSEPR